MKLPPAALLALVIVLSPIVGCSDRARDRPAPPAPERQRRVIEPAVGIVRALPPHAIRADGVGPYRLGDRMSSVLDQLPSGPRIALFEIPGLLHRSLIRAEDDTVLIGGEPGSTVSSIAVVGAEVARTETGIHVGSTREALVQALGPLTSEIDRASDPRLVAPGGLRNARMVLDADRIAAIVITAESGTSGAPVAAPRDAGTETACPRPAARGKAFGACLTRAGELVEVGEREISVRVAETERVIATLPLPARIVFAAPLRATELRDELVVVMRTEDDAERTWSLVSYRFEAGRISRSIEPTPLYRLSSSNARWIGAELDDVELYLELVARPDAIEVGGLLTTRAVGQGPPSWRDVVVISPVSVARRQPKAAAPEPFDAPAAPDAGVVRDASLDPDASADESDDPGAHRSKP